MKTPLLQRMRIIRHSDFCDIPHHIIAIDNDFFFWVLVSPFDKLIDDYSAEFVMYCVGTDSHAARDIYEMYVTDDSKAMLGSFSKIPVLNVEFDETSEIGCSYTKVWRIREPVGWTEPKRQLSGASSARKFHVEGSTHNRRPGGRRTRCAPFFDAACMPHRKIPSKSPTAG